jgi:hypothetical protein
MWDSELESFKQKIDLRAYASAIGYTLHAKESWRGSAVMRHANGDKIIVKLAPDGHFVYYSVHRDNDNGTIIDFVQKRQRMSLGALRKELRPWIGLPPVPVPAFPVLQATSRDRMKVEAEFAKTQDVTRHTYLENERALPSSLFTMGRFLGRIRSDRRGNALFPHTDADGLCGFEIKNKGFTGFSKGGTKGLWMSNTFETDQRIVFCESAIDALSHAVLFPDATARYASIGGKLNPMQPELIRAAVARMPAGAEIIAAMDADEDGAKLAEIVRKAVDLSGRKDLRFTLQEPFGFNDWNDQIRAQPPLAAPGCTTRAPTP